MFVAAVAAGLAGLASAQPLGQAEGPGQSARISVDRLALAGVDGRVLAYLYACQNVG